MSLPVVLGALAFLFITVLTVCLCKAAAQGDAQQDELEPRRRAKQNGIKNIERSA
jgi:hypothetical protein